MRRGFTLVEVAVALAVTALVASLAWAAVQAGLDTGDRMRAGREGIESEATARAFLAAALRHVEPGGRGGPPVFELDPGDRPGAARLRFLSRGVQQPFGATSPWSVAVRPTGGGLLIEASPGEPGAHPIRMRLGRIEGLAVSVMATGAGAWQDRWGSPDVAPGRVALHLVARGPAGTLPPVVARVGLGSDR